MAEFVVDSDVDLRTGIVKRKEEIETETATRIMLLSFEQWVDYELERSTGANKAPLGYHWLKAVVESFAQKRLTLAPIDEPCDAWIGGLIRILS